MGEHNHSILFYSPDSEFRLASSYALTEFRVTSDVALEMHLSIIFAGTLACFSTPLNSMLTVGSI